MGWYFIASSALDLAQANASKSGKLGRLILAAKLPALQ